MILWFYAPANSFPQLQAQELSELTTLFSQDTHEFQQA